MKISEDNPLPLYYQLREDIRNKILSGEWKYGQVMPSETQLCHDLNLSRSTVKQAFDGLVADGLIVRKRGKGTFVNYNKLSYNLLTEPNFYQQMENEGANQKSIIIVQGHIGANEKISKILSIPIGTDVCHFKRVRYIDNVPMLIQDVYIKKEFEQGLLENDLSEISFYKYIEEKNNIVLDFFHIDISTLIFSNEESKLFLTSGPLSGFLFNTVYYHQDKLIMYSDRYFRGDMINLSLDYQYNKKQKSNKEFLIMKGEESIF